MGEASKAAEAADTTASPEFQAAVKAAVAAQMDGLRDEFAKMIAGARKKAGSAETSDDMDFANKMAMAIATLTDQGTGRKRVAPEILEQRAKASVKMMQLIADARAKGEVPSYTLKAKTYLEEVLIEPIYIGADHKQHPTEIDWPGVPNEAMRPSNDVARGIYAAYKDSIGSIDKDYEKPLHGVTPGGLVIKSRAGQPIRQVDAPAADRSVRIHHKDGRPGQHKEINVLGTVAPPARQQA